VKLPADKQTNAGYTITSLTEVIRSSTSLVVFLFNIVSVNESRMTCGRSIRQTMVEMTKPVLITLNGDA